MIKCTKFDFGWGSAPEKAKELLGLQRSPDPLLRGPTCKGGEEMEGKGMERGN